MKKLLANLSLRQKITIVIVAVALVAGIYSLVHWQNEQDFKPLFTGVSPEDGAAIIQKLRESGVEYRLPEGGGSVLVPSARLAELRLNMAAAGLPKTGRIGFELFDKTNLGATEFTEHINYRRALEGELERSVMSIDAVEQARVHLTFSKDSVFLEAQEPAKASVLVKVRAGAHLAAPNVNAITHLVASAVEGLAPEAVSVLDMNGNLLSHPKAASLDGSESSQAGLDYKHQMETDLVAKINATLEPLLGANKFRAGVSVDCDFSGGDQSEEVFDPARTVMASSQRTEDSAGVAGAGGVPGTASTLPRPSSRPGGAGSNKVTRMTENIIYQATRTVKKTHLPPGTIRKISLAILVDQDLSWEPDKTGFKRILAAPSPEKLKTIRDLVAGIAGLNTERGDQLVVETLPFESTLSIDPPEKAQPVAAKPPGPLTWPPNRNTLLIGGGAAVGLIVLGFLAAMLLRGGKRRPTVSANRALAAPEDAQAEAKRRDSIEEKIESKLAERDAAEKELEAQALKALTITPVITKTAEILAKHLREKIKTEPEISAQVLRAWIHEKEDA